MLLHVYQNFPLIKFRLLRMHRFLHSLRRGNRETRGTLTFSQLLRQSPSVMAIYLLRARSRNQNFTFTLNLSGEEYFTEILTVVFHPDGMTVEVFKQFIQGKRMLGPYAI